MARILLGVSGSIAAYKALEFVRLASAAGHSLRVIETAAATRFVGPLSFDGITGAPTLIDEFAPDPFRGVFPGDEPPMHALISHLELVARADLFLIAPASINTIAKLAGGHADNLLTTAASACRAPLLLAPAANDAMYDNPATQANITTLRERGVTVLEPGVGRLGSPGEWGAGRLPEPADLLAAAELALSQPARGDATDANSGAAGVTVAKSGTGMTGSGMAGATVIGSDVAAASSGTTGDGADEQSDAAYAGHLDGVRVLVTAGGTREPIDAVRYLGNRSSGRMGFALAARAARRGAEVSVIAANTGSLERDPQISYRDVISSTELAEACKERFGSCDVLLMAAAVADYRPTQETVGKIKKAAAARLDLRLERTEDVLAGLAKRRRPDQILVGFAAEVGDGAVAYGRDKLQRKGLDAVVVNDVGEAGIGFDTDENEVTIVTVTDEVRVARAPKSEIADAVLDTVCALLALRATSP